jgi:hypothetical protein
LTSPDLVRLAARRERARFEQRLLKSKDVVDPILFQGRAGAILIGAGVARLAVRIGSVAGVRLRGVS